MMMNGETTIRQVARGTRKRSSGGISRQHRRQLGSPHLSEPAYKIPLSGLSPSHASLQSLALRTVRMYVLYCAHECTVRTV
jgi:hypothetical protein